jgi:hypothetical protein
MNSFGLGTTKRNGHFLLYVAYENEDPDGFSRVYVTRLARRPLDRERADPRQ